MKIIIENVKSFCKDIGLKVLSEEYIGIDDKMSFEDSDGASNLINGHNYSVFNKSNSYTIDNIKLWLKINKMSCELISTKYEDNTKQLIFKCKDCGLQYKCSWNRMLDEKIERCKRCSKSQSSYENKVEDLLIVNDLIYEREYKFEDCKYILPLPFDFAIFDDNKIICLIECDGIQHYKSVDFFGGEEGFRLNQIRDNIKNEYCKSNNIKLIRIPYWQFEHDEYIKIINNMCLL